MYLFVTTVPGLIAESVHSGPDGSGPGVFLIWVVTIAGMVAVTAIADVAWKFFIRTS